MRRMMFLINNLKELVGEVCLENVSEAKTDGSAFPVVDSFAKFIFLDS